MERKAIVCCALSLLLASCDGGGGTWVTDTASTTSTGSTTGTTPPSSSQQTDGQVPMALIQATDGNFYGVTQGGGTNGVGTFFRLTTAGVETVLYSFAGGTADGAYPWGLIQGSDGNFYGTTKEGGVQTCSLPNSGGSGTTTAACGVLFQVTSTGAESIVYFFTGQSDGSIPTGRLIQAGNGSLYGTAEFGGLVNTSCPSGCGVVYQIPPGGAESALYSFKGTAASDGQAPTSVTQGTDGNLYGATISGGPGNFGTIFALTTGGTETVLHSFLGTSDGSSPAAALIEGADGSFYGTAIFGGTAGAGTIFNVTTAGVETTLYSFTGSPDGAIPTGNLLLASDGEFYGATDDGGNVTTCNSGCGTVFSLTTTGQESILYNFPAAGTTTSPVAPEPGGLIQATDGNLYGITLGDGQYGYGTVYRMNFSGTKTVIYSFGAPQT